MEERREGDDKGMEREEAKKNEHERKKKHKR